MRLLFAIAAVLGLLLTAPLAAAADTLPARASARRLMVSGDVAGARVLLARILEGDVSPAERAASAELLFVLDAWPEAGPPRGPRAPSGAPSAARSPEHDWHGALFEARELMIAGSYEDASRRLDDLVATAPDLVAGARAMELRALAREVAPPPAPRTEARSEAPVDPEPSAPETESSWYGWQTLLLDGAALVTTPFMPGVGVGTYALGGPIVHAAHGRVAIGAASLGIRVGAPLVGAFTGAVVGGTNCNGDFCGLGGALVGGVLGIVTAVVLDAAVLAREQVRAPRSSTSSASARFVPSVAPRANGGVDVGVGGTF